MAAARWNPNTIARWRDDACIEISWPNAVGLFGFCCCCGNTRDDNHLASAKHLKKLNNWSEYTDFDRVTQSCDYIKQECARADLQTLMSFDADLAQMFAEAMTVQLGQEAHVAPPAAAPAQRWGPPPGLAAAAARPPPPPTGPGPTTIGDLELAQPVTTERVATLEATRVALLMEVETMDAKLKSFDAV